MKLLIPIIYLFVLLFSAAAVAAVDKSLTWVPYLELSRDKKQFIADTTPRMLELIGDGKGVFTLSLEMDGDGVQDAVLYFANREECGVDGRLYVMIYSAGKAIKAYTAIDFKVTADGVVLDGKVMDEN